MATRVYWVGLKILVKKLCDYWNRYKSKMPSDLPASVNTAMVALDIACTALLAYDALKVRGNPDNLEGV